MNDRELAAKLDELADFNELTPQEAGVLRVASRRLTELGREVADELEPAVYDGCVVRDIDTGWVTIERHRHGVVNAARELVRMGLWEENHDVDDIEHIEFRPVKGTP